jgi:hypothetical protein
MYSVFCTEAAHDKVDMHCESGPYERLKFNPNNQEKIALPWSKKELCAIFGKVSVGYMKMMHLYTTVKGGGNNDCVTYSVWE